MAERDEHLRASPLIDALLGPGHGVEPTSRELVDHLAGEPGGSRGVAIAEFLAEHPVVADAARAGLDEIERFEGGFAHAALTVPLPPLRLAAETVEDGAPVPEDRRVLDERRGEYRLTWYREGGVARIALFVEAPGRAAAIHAQLDGIALAAHREGGSISTVDVGRPASLVGRRLDVELVVGDTTRVLSWTLIPE